jgi:hypothetical protein
MRFSRAERVKGETASDRQALSQCRSLQECPITLIHHPAMPAFAFDLDQKNSTWAAISVRLRCRETSD